MNVVSCMILHHPTVQSLTKSKILRAMFCSDKYEGYEIHVLNKEQVMVYVCGGKKDDIRQYALLLEISNIKVGYGFAKNKIDARKQAEETLNKRLNYNNLQ